IDMIPCFLLLVFSFLQKKEKYSCCRWMPLTVLLSRLVLDLVALLLRESDICMNLTFDMILDNLSITEILLALAALSVIAALCCRSTYFIGNLAFLFIYGLLICLDLSGSGMRTPLRIVWALAYFLLHISILLLGVTLTSENRYCKKLGETIEKLLYEIMQDETEEEYPEYGEYEEGFPEQYEILGTIGQKVEEQLKYLYLLMRTPENETVIFVKDMEKNRYSVLTDYEEAKEVLAAYYNLVIQDEDTNDTGISV
ncbi:MAG: hypothetical protein ACI4V1_10560, partial [Eubacteriales bacterium]